MPKDTFDLILLGGGAGAFAAAIRANELNAKTALVNAGLPLGGTCVNVGCVPSKTLLWAGEVMHHAQHHGIPGIELTIQRFDFPKVVQDELALVERLRQEKYEKVLSALENVTFIEGTATFLSPYEIEVSSQRLRGEKFIIATGSTATVPPIKGMREVGYVTHIEALKLERQPKDLIVVGAGPLGLEFAQMYARFGTKVTILQKGSSVFPPTEPELSARLAEILAGEDITIHTNVEVKAARREGNQKVLTYESQGKTAEVRADEILLATGKTPNTDSLGLEHARVEITERKAISVNSHLQTSAANLYAVGDVTNLPLRLETTAGREGTLAAENALTGSEKTIDYGTVSYAIFTDPQLAGVGLTEVQEMRELGRCACRTVSFKDVPKALITRRTEGIIKMAIHPDTREILGVHLLAPNAGDLIAQAMTLVMNKNTIDDVVDSLPVFPTMSEAIKIVALSFTRDISKLSCCV
jgi:mercuric reductase